MARETAAERLHALYVDELRQSLLRRLEAPSNPARAGKDRSTEQECSLSDSAPSARGGELAKAAKERGRRLSEELKKE